MKKTFILLIIILLPLNLFSQNRQNKYYNPFRFSVSALSKFAVGLNDSNTDKYLFDQAIGIMGELIYTLDQKAKYEISMEAGIMKTFYNPDNTSTKNHLIPISIKAYYYFFDEEFSPFIGIGFGFENFDSSNKPVLKPMIGISNKKLNVFARYGIGNKIGSSVEVGIGYSFKERPCGCFPQSR